jgi:hypothetical protein
VFVPVFQVEVVIALCFELLVELLLALLGTGVPLGLVELLAVLFENVIGGQVYASPEPVVLHQLTLSVYQLEITEVSVRRRRHRV